MKYDYKYKGLAEKIKEILQENFPKNKGITDIKSALLDDDDFINELTDAVKDNFTIDDMNRMFTKDEICSLIDSDDLYHHFDSDEMLDAVSNNTIIRYLENEGYIGFETQDDWMPIDHIMKACSDILPRTVKTAEDMKRIVCDEIDKQDTGNVFI
mgnify:FL=1